MSTSEGKCVLVEVGALISWCRYSIYRIVILLVRYMWASMTFLPRNSSIAKRGAEVNSHTERGNEINPYLGSN